MADGVHASSSRCTSCGAVVALHAARPRITGDGRIQLECEPCSRGERPAPIAVAVAVVEAVEPRPRRRPPVFATGASVAVIAAVAWIGESASGELPAAATAAAALEVDDEVAGIGAPAAPAVTAVVVPAAPAFEIPPMPQRDGVLLDVVFPVLGEWIHPVPGSPEVIPHRSSRLFGARREHAVKRECGGGHCGVDLEGTRGQTLVAVSWGKVARIQPADVGSGGRYVRIEHPGDVFTTYFHLDGIAPGLELGAEIEAGEPVGSLGRSGIRVSMPHLHFSLELPTGNGGGVRFVDPLPFLARAEVLPRDAVPDLADAAAQAAEPYASVDLDAPLDGETDADPIPAVN